MTATASFRRTAIGLMLLLIISGVSIAFATLENGYKADNSFLTAISESTRTENGYKIRIVINPDIVGIYAEENGYKLDLAICPEGVGGALEENGYRLDLEPEKLFPDVALAPALVHDVAVTNDASSKTVLGQGVSISINVTVANQGGYAETFNATAYANTTMIASQNVALPAGKSATVTFTWNTAGFAYGNYALSAYAWPVAGETSTANNNFTGGTVKVTIAGDINGDFTVDLYDAVTLAGSYNSLPTNSNWNANADINGNNIVDLYDAIMLASHYNEHYP